VGRGELAVCYFFGVDDVTRKKKKGERIAAVDEFLYRYYIKRPSGFRNPI